MSDLAWNWLCAPYAITALGLAAVALVTALIRGDRVMRLGVIAAVVTALPWAICSALAACTDDPPTATRLLRLGTAPVSLIGASLLVVLLGVTGQLERNRWVARFAAAAGGVMLVLGWSTPWVVPGVHRLRSGLLYVYAGPLTALNISQLGIWLAAGLFIARRSSTGGESRHLARLVLVVLALGAVGASDLLLVYDVAGVYPIAWLPALIASVIALVLVLRTDLLRPQGLDRGVLIEVIGFAVAVAGFVAVAIVMRDATAVAKATVGSAVWVTTLGVAWIVARRRPAQVAGERALEQLIGELAEPTDDTQVAALIATLWRDAIGVVVRTTWIVDRTAPPSGGVAGRGSAPAVEGGALIAVGSAAPRWELARETIAWLTAYAGPLAAGDLATLRLGAIRPQLEALVAAHGTTLIVPLIDRGTLVGLIEAEHVQALREEERGLVVESARAAARALTYVALGRSAALEGETAREVEVAQAMRLSASASRDDELGRWVVAAEYRTAPHTTGAGWSVSLLGDGRLAVLVTEAQAHGIPAALATAALTGAFAAATTGGKPIRLDDLVASLRSSAEGVVRGGEPVAAFVAILDHDAATIDWACAGHPGGQLIGSSAQSDLGGGGDRLGASLALATRGSARMAPEASLVVASTALRGDDPARWQAAVRGLARTGPRLATALVDDALRRGEPAEDLLALVVRLRLPGMVAIE